MDNIEALYDDFNVYYKSKESWYYSAYHLMGAAGALWTCWDEARSKELVKELGLEPEFSMVHALHGPYLMLCGMSLELLYKAIVVAKGGEPSRSHNLLSLAKEAGVVTTEKQNGWLEVLSGYVIWSGRYPVPLPKHSTDYARLYMLESQHLWNFQKEPGSKLNRLLPNTQLDWEPFHQLWKHAQEIYRQYER